MSIRIIVEGNDDKNFIISFLNYLKSIGELKVLENINFQNYIEVMKGKSKLLDSNNIKYKRLSQKIAYRIKGVLFIFDCDFSKDDNKCGGMINSKRCFEELKEALNWNIFIDYFIFDKNLDYFLLETIKERECYENFNSLVDCLEVEKLKPNKKPIANLYKDLQPYPPFDFKHQKFQPLKDKLIELFKHL